MNRRTLIWILSLIAVAAIVTLIVLAIKGDLSPKPTSNQPQIAQFDVNTTTVAPGQTVILSYLVLNATKLTIDNGIGQLTNPETGTVYSLPLTEQSTYTFTLSAYGSDPSQPPVTSTTNTVSVLPQAPLPPQIQNIVITSLPVGADGVQSLFSLKDSNVPYAYIALDNTQFYINFKCDITNDPNAYFVLSYPNSQGIITTQINAQPLMQDSTTEFFFPVPGQGADDRVFTLTANGQGGSSAAQIAVFVNKDLGSESITGTISSSSVSSKSVTLPPNIVPQNGTLFIDWQAPGSTFALLAMNTPPQSPYPNNFISMNRYLFPSGSNVLLPVYIPGELIFSLLIPGEGQSQTLIAGTTS